MVITCIPKLSRAIPEPWDDAPPPPEFGRPHPPPVHQHPDYNNQKTGSATRQFADGAGLGKQLPAKPNPLDSGYPTGRCWRKLSAA